MFQYTHELVFNSLTMPDGSDRIIFEVGAGKPLVIQRGGEYFKAFIQSQGANEHVVYRTDGVVGKNEILSINASKLPTDPGTYQLNMFVKLLDPHAIYEFGYPNYNTFGRQILIGYDVVSTDTAATIAAKLHESLLLALRDEEFKVGGQVVEGALQPFAENDTVVSLLALHPALRFDCVGLSFYDETTCDSCIGEYLAPVDILKNDDASVNAASIAVAGVVPFATGEWLQENLRFPTYPNTRYHAPGYGDYPTPGVVYTQFSFAYQSPRPGLGGLSGVGQAMMAITRHVYYVPTTEADKFQTAFENLGATVVTTNDIQVTNPDTNVVEAASSSNSGE